MSKQRSFSKVVWAKALKDEKRKAKRLKLKANSDGVFICPVQSCESNGFNSQRGCRKHVHTKHGWFYFFDEKPDISTYFPQLTVAANPIAKTQRGHSSSMPLFIKDCEFGKRFANWLCSPGGSGKSKSQAEQTAIKVLKYLKFCCPDQLSTWDIPDNVVDYCIGSMSSIADFIDYLQGEPFKIGHSGVIAYMDALSHLLDQRRCNQVNSEKNVHVFIATEVYLDRVKKCLKKKLHVQWNEVLSLEYLSSINCWASLKDMQLVVPFHCDKYNQIVLIAKEAQNNTPPHDLSFCTSFIICLLFLEVKGTRPMTYQQLSIDMLDSVPKEGGMIDCTKFKTAEKYGFDSIILSQQILSTLNDYKLFIRTQLNEKCNLLLITRNGTEVKKIGDIFGRMVFQAIGKYIHPTRYRQIVESTSAEMLSPEEQQKLSLDQKHSSRVAKVHYQKMESQKVAIAGQQCMQKMIKSSCQNNSTSDGDIEFAVERKNDSDADSLLIEKTTRLMSVPDHPKENALSSKNTVQVVVEDIVKSQRQKIIPFSNMEDKFLQDGIQKHGKSWTRILKDPSFKFQSSRQHCTFAQRAKKLGLV